MLDEHLDGLGGDEGDGDAGEEKDANGNNVSKKKPKYLKEEMRKIQRRDQRRNA